MVYVFDMKTGCLIRKLTDPNHYAGVFGWSIALNGDTAVIGAPYDKVKQTQEVGQAYIFDVSNGKLLHTLDSAHPQYFGQFGWSVAISGTLVVVGADFESIGGRAYVFDTLSGRIIQELKSPNEVRGGLFGFSVAISGSTVAVGARFENVMGYNYFEAGRVHIFNASTGKIIQNLFSPNVQELGWYGSSVALDGKILAVGSSECADGYCYAGRVYVYREDCSVCRYKLLFTLVSPHVQYDGFFGDPVALSQRFILVGAYDETAKGIKYAGHAYIFYEPP